MGTRVHLPAIFRIPCRRAVVYGADDDANLLNDLFQVVLRK